MPRSNGQAFHPGRKQYASSYLLCAPHADRFHDADGDPILAEFFVKFQQQAEALSVPADALYNALLADAELQPPNWDLQGRQANIWKTLGESRAGQDIGKGSNVGPQAMSRKMYSREAVRTRSRSLVLWRCVPVTTGATTTG